MSEPTKRNETDNGIVEPTTDTQEAILGLLLAQVVRLGEGLSIDRDGDLLAQTCDQIARMAVSNAEDDVKQGAGPDVRWLASQDAANLSAYLQDRYVAEVSR